MTHLMLAALLLLFGWLVKYQKATELISGYNTAPAEKKKQYDTEKLAKYTGNFLFLLGFILLAVALLCFLFQQYELYITLIGFGVFVVTIFAGLIYLNTGNRLKKTDDKSDE